MNVGREPIHWTLKGVASLSVIASSIASSVRSICRRAASLSMPNDHS